MTMARTTIEWTDTVWNPVRGCTRVSEGCRNCYAERQAIRFAGPGQPYEGLVRSTPQGPSWTGRIQLVEEKLTEPLRWRRPRRVFVNSMSDLFHPEVPTEFIERVFAVMAVTPQHTYQILTRRPERMNHLVAMSGFQILVAGAAQHMGFRDRLVGRTWDGFWPLPNVWLGVSVEDQVTADERIPHLLNTPAAVRFLSCEPLLGAIDLRRWMHPDHLCGCGGHCDASERCPLWQNARRLDWVIVGGESGPGARPMHPDWVRGIRDQCQAANVPFFFKQWGAWEPDGWVHADTKFDRRHTTFNGRGEIVSDRTGLTAADNLTMRRVGKRAAGRLLDGRTWDQMPGVTA